MSIKAIFFDLDGTLVNSLDDLTQAMNYALSRVNVPTISTRDCCKMIGNGMKKFASRALPDDKQVLIGEVVSLLRSYYQTHYLDNTKPYGQITELTKNLHKMGMMLFVVTNKDQDLAKGIIGGLFAEGLFAGVYGASDQFPLKPSPELPFNIMDNNKLEPGEILFVGDSDVDVETAIACGFKAVGVSWGMRDREVLVKAGADVVIDKPLELLELVS